MTTQSLGAATLTYDAASRLSKTIINGTETQLLYDGTNLVAEYNNTGTLLKRYVHSNGIDEPIVIYNDASTTNKNWFYADHLGSIVALANTTGAATANYTYSAEGKQGGSTANRFGYTGQQNLSGLGVQYYKARMYSADLGRFIQIDPIGMADDMNLYAYVGNNAVNRVDPSGLAGVALGNFGSSVKNDFSQSVSAVKNTDLSFDGLMNGLNSLGPVGVEMGAGLKGIGMLGASIKGISVGEELNFSVKAAEHMENPARAVPVQILQDAIQSSQGVPDPRGSTALMHTIEMYKNDTAYQLEVLYNKATNAIWHFQYDRPKGP